MKRSQQLEVKSFNIGIKKISNKKILCKIEINKKIYKEELILEQSYIPDLDLDAKVYMIKLSPGHIQWRLELFGLTLSAETSQIMHKILDLYSAKISKFIK